MAGYSTAKRLAVATFWVPLLAIILYQAVNSNWYAGFNSSTFHQHLTLKAVKTSVTHVICQLGEV